MKMSHYVITSEGKFCFDIEGDLFVFKLSDFEEIFCKIFDVNFCGDEDESVCIAEINEEVICLYKENGYCFLKLNLEDSCPEYVIFTKDDKVLTC